MPKNFLLSETSIIVVLVTNRGRARPFDHSHRCSRQKRERWNSREESCQPTFINHNGRRCICPLNIQLIFTFSFLCPPISFQKDATLGHYLWRDRKEIQIKKKKKQEIKAKRKRRQDKDNVYYMLQEGLLLWLKLDSRLSCNSVGFNAFTYKWQRKGEDRENKENPRT